MKFKTLSSLTLLSVFAFATTTFAADGKELFEKNHCNMCHSVNSQKIESKHNKLDLSDIGKKHADADFYKKWLLKEVEDETPVKPGVKVKHQRPKWDGSDADLTTLANWLAGLK